MKLINTEIEPNEISDEIKRLSEYIGKSRSFLAGMWAIQTLIDEYEKITDEKYEY